MTLKADTQIPMALHSANADEADARSGTRTVGRQAKNTLDDVSGAVAKFNAAVRDVRADPTLS